jgi:hypothetical protein
MAFAQLTYRESLRDIESCLRALQSKLYHMGFHGRVSRSTLADANESHDWRIFAEFAQVLIGIARPRGCVTAKFKGCFGKTTQVERCSCPAASGMGASPTQTRKGRAPVPVIRQLADRLEIHRLRAGTPVAGPIFANSLGKPLSLGSVVNRHILPALNRCETCGKAERGHGAAHPYRRDGRIPDWHGWHAARRGTRKQPVSTGSARHGNSANLETCEREHHGNVLHQDCRRRCSQGDDYAGKPHRGG